MIREVHVREAARSTTGGRIASHPELHVPDAGRAGTIGTPKIEVTVPRRPGQNTARSYGRAHHQEDTFTGVCVGESSQPAGSSRKALVDSARWASSSSGG